VSEPETGPDGIAARQRPWGLLIGFAAVLAGLLWLATRGGSARDADPLAEAESSTGAAAGAGDGDDTPKAVAHVRGQVWLEVPVPRAKPPVVVVIPGSDGEVYVEDTGSGDTGEPSDTEGTDDAEADEPVEPAPVDLTPPEPGTCRVVAWQEGVRVGEALCDDAGAYSVALDPGVSGVTAFEVLVPGRLRAVLQVDVPAGGAGRLPEVALGVGVGVIGQVVDARGDPVQGALVAAMPSPNLSEPEPWRAWSDATGVFVLDTLPPGPVSMRVSADGFEPSLVEALAPQDDVVATLSALIDLNGRVVGQPEVLARTRVRLEGSAIWPAIETEVDPKTGRFAFAKIPDGIYALEAIAPAPKAEPDAPELASFPLENVTPELDVTLALGPAVRAHVRVLGPSGEPVPNARVTLANASVGMLSRVAVTDAEGVVALGPVVPGPYVLRGEADGFLPAEPVAVTLAPPPPDEAAPETTLTLLLPGTLAGTVVDENDQPVPDATIEFEAEHLHTAGEGQARARMFAAALSSAGSLGVTQGPVPPIPLTDTDVGSATSSVHADALGNFRIEMLSPGRYRLAAHHGHYAASEAISVSVAAGATRGKLVLVLRTGFVLTGRVHAGNGQPLSGVMVVAGDGASATTDAQGVFDLGRRRGTQRLVFRRSGYAPVQRVVNVRGATDIDVTMRAADGIVEGRIQGENGEVLVDARVTLRPRDGLSSTRIAWTDERGLYRFEDVPPGAAEIEVDHRDHAAGAATLSVSDSGTASPVPTDLSLRKGWAVDLVVRAAGTRSPVDGARVVAGGRSSQTNAFGEAALDNLTGDSVSVRVEAAEYGVWRSTITAPSGGGRAEVEAFLSQGGGISGRITDYRGDPVVGARVVVTPAQGSQEAVVTHSDAAGKWSVQGLPEGDYTAAAAPPAARSEELAADAQETDIRRGHVTRGVDLRFDRG